MNTSCTCFSSFNLVCLRLAGYGALWLRNPQNPNTRFFLHMFNQLLLQAAGCQNQYYQYVHFQKQDGDVDPAWTLLHMARVAGLVDGWITEPLMAATCWTQRKWGWVQIHAQQREGEAIAPGYFVSLIPFLGYLNQLHANFPRDSNPAAFGG